VDWGEALWSPGPVKNVLDWVAQLKHGIAAAAAAHSSCSSTAHPHIARRCQSGCPASTASKPWQLAELSDFRIQAGCSTLPHPQGRRMSSLRSPGGRSPTRAVPCSALHGGRLDALLSAAPLEVALSSLQMGFGIAVGSAGK